MVEVGIGLNDVGGFGFDIELCVLLLGFDKVDV